MTGFTRTAAIISYLLVYATSINAAEWHYLNPFPVPGDIIDIQVLSDQDCVLLTDGGLLRHSSDGGNSWSEIIPPHTDSWIKAIDFSTPENGWLIGNLNEDNPGEQFVYSTSNAGQSYREIILGSQDYSANFTLVQDMGDNVAWFGGTAYHDLSNYPAVVKVEGENPGEMQLIREAPGTNVHCMYFLTERIGWIVGSDGFTALTNDGRNWSVVDPVTEYDLYDVYFTDINNGWAVGGNFNTGVILSSNDGGNSWSIIEDNPAASNVTNLAESSAGRFIAVTEGWNQFPAQILESRDGLDWREIHSINNHLIHSISIGDNLTLIGGDNGYLERSADLRNYNVTSSNVIPGSINDIFIGDDIYIGGSAGKLLRQDDNDQWIELETGVNTDIYTINIHNDGRGWVTTSNSRELFTENHGQGWEIMDFADEDVNLMEFSGITGYATHGTYVSVTQDYGQNWSTSEVIQGQRIPATALSVISPEVAYVTSPGDSLRRTTDGGRSWHAVPAPFRYCFGISFSSENPENGLALGSSTRSASRVYITNDGGDSWRSGQRFDGVPGGILYGTEDFAWLWENPGKVWASLDGGMTWDNQYINVEQIIRKIEHYSPPYVEDMYVCGDGSLLARWINPVVSVPERHQSRPYNHLLSSTYPNPTNSAASVVYTGTGSEIITYQILNSTGRIVQDKLSSTLQTGENHINIPLHHLPAGTYFIQFYVNQQRFTRSVVLIR